MQPSSFSNSNSCSRPLYSWPSVSLPHFLSFPTTFSTYIWFFGAWLRLNRLFGSYLLSRLDCLPSCSQPFYLSSNQLVTARDFNPPDDNRQVPLTAEPRPPSNLTGWLITSWHVVINKHPINLINRHHLVHTQNQASSMASGLGNHWDFPCCTLAAHHPGPGTFSWLSRFGLSQLWLTLHHWS